MKIVKILFVSTFIALASSGLILAQAALVDIVPDFYYLGDTKNDIISIHACSNSPIQGQSSVAGLTVSGLDCKAVAEVTQQDLDNFLDNVLPEKIRSQNYNLEEHKLVGLPAAMVSAVWGLGGITRSIERFPVKRQEFSSVSKVLVALLKFKDNSALVFKLPIWFRLALTGSTFGVLSYVGGKELFELGTKGMYISKLQGFQEQIRTGMLWGKAARVDFTKFINEYGMQPSS